ncbi:autotransporter outer membrane beta-barrel domain-containing protein [Ekhidna sp.]
MKHQITRLLTVGFFLLSISSFAQSVGIGTEEPNSNAILELVAPDNNQGLLVPRMTTSERNADSFTSNLSASDNGLMVYDEDENKFFFWITDQWVGLASGNIDPLPNQAGQNNKYLTTDGSNTLWSDLDFDNLTNVPADLSDGDDDTQLSDTDITALGYIKNANDADADASNEFQDLTISGNTLSLTNSSSAVDLSPFAGTNTDNQTLSLSGNNLSITGGNAIDISSINTNLTETDVDNFANNNGYLLSEVDGSTSNEIQNISTDGTAGDITLSSGSSLTLNVNDADSNPTNEDQTVSAGTGISVSQSGDDFEVTNSAPDQTVSLADGGNGNVTIGGTYPNLTIDVPNNLDNSITNEIELPTQTSQNGNFLTTDGTNPSWSSITQSQWNTSGTTINYATGNVGINEASPGARLDVVGTTELNGAVDVNSTLDVTGQLTVTNDVEIPATNAYTYASAKTKVASYHPTEFQVLNVAIAEEVLLTPLSVNLYVFFSGGSGGQAFATAPVKLPDNAVITQVDAWVVDNDAAEFVRVELTRNQIGLSTFNQNMSVVQTDAVTQSTVVTQLTDNTIFNGTIDNSTYAYFLRFTSSDSDGSELQLHGIKITYTVSQAD